MAVSVFCFFKYCCMYTLYYDNTRGGNSLMIEFEVCKCCAFYVSGLSDYPHITLAAL